MQVLLRIIELPVITIVIARFCFFLQVLVYIVMGSNVVSLTAQVNFVQFRVLESIRLSIAKILSGKAIVLTEHDVGLVSQSCLSKPNVVSVYP